MNVSNMTTLPPTPVPTPNYQVMHTGLEHKKTIRLLKGESTYFLMDTFNLTTECRQIHDYCPGTNLYIRMEGCYGAAIIIGQVLGWPLNEPGGFTYESRKLKESMYVEAFPPFALEHWYYYWMVQAMSNATYELVARCESALCPATMPRTFYELPDKKIAKVGDVTLTGFTVDFPLIEINCEDPEVHCAVKITNETCNATNASMHGYNCSWPPKQIITLLQPDELPSEILYEVFAAKVRNQSDTENIYQNHWNPCGVRECLNPIANFTSTRPGPYKELVFVDAVAAGMVQDEAYLVQVLATTQHPNGTRLEEFVYTMHTEQFTPVLGDPMDDPGKKKKLIIIVAVGAALVLPILVFKVISDQKDAAKIEAIKEKARLQMELQMMGGKRKKKKKK